MQVFRWQATRDAAAREKSSLIRAQSFLKRELLQDFLPLKTDLAAGEPGENPVSLDGEHG